MGKAGATFGGCTDRSQLQNLASSGFALAVQLLRNRDDAADVVQDAFAKVFAGRGAYDPQQGEARAWFLKIVRNCCLDVLRRRSRRATTDLEATEPPADRGLTPAAAAEQGETLRLLKERLLDMPRDQREIIVLRDYHDLSYAEMSRVLSIPAGTVMSRLHRARMELRRRMELD